MQNDRHVEFASCGQFVVSTVTPGADSAAL
jgi:hypothetical protein